MRDELPILRGLLTLIVALILLPSVRVDGLTSTPKVAPHENSYLLVHIETEPDLLTREEIYALVVEQPQMAARLRASNAQALRNAYPERYPTTTTTTTLPPTTTTTTTAAPVAVAEAAPAAQPRAPHPCDLVPRPRGRGLIYLTDRTMELCPQVAPWFDPWDLQHALLVIECESNGDPYANDHWQKDGRSKYPLGIWSHINIYYVERSRDLLGFVIDPYDPREASMLAAKLVYHTSSGWGHWASCHAADGRAIQRTLDAS